jgi:hypothetical protein
MSCFAIVIAANGLLALACIYMLIRCDWVFRKRTDLIWTDMARYERLPSYEAMMLRYPFTWSLEKIEAKRRIETGESKQ